jgi:hypothetical protein
VTRAVAECDAAAAAQANRPADVGADVVALDDVAVGVEDVDVFVAVPAMTFRSVSVVPPIVAPPKLMMSMPRPLFGSAFDPVISSPMKLPAILTLTA